jgi:putative hydrolase of the HAD superfamily
MKYKHLFFDWDHTLWDFEKNSEMSLRNLYINLGLQGLGLPSFEQFFEKYITINDLKWDMYRAGTIDKQTLRETRFRETFEHFGVDSADVAWELELRYLQETPYQNHLIENAAEVLKELKAAGCVLHVITNGFHESQNIKFSESGLEPLFDLLLCSDQVGVNKPDPKIFRRALQLTGADRKESLMIGDNLIADCVGAREQGIDQVFYNPSKVRHAEKVTYEISDLKQLVPIILHT